jgi:hypothetical protein
MVLNITDAFMKFERRAEGVELQKLVETFVDKGLSLWLRCREMW